jgi:DNA-binding FadR family transcriptional regulator
MMERAFPTVGAARRWVMLYTLGDGLPRASTELSWECGIYRRALYETIAKLEQEGLVHVDRRQRPFVVQVIFPPVATEETAAHA